MPTEELIPVVNKRQTHGAVLPAPVVRQSMDLFFPCFTIFLFLTVKGKIINGLFARPALLTFADCED